MSQSSAPLSRAPSYGLCQSVCAAVMQPARIVLESHAVAGLDATVLSLDLRVDGDTTGPLTRRH